MTVEKINELFNSDPGLAALVMLLRFHGVVLIPSKSAPIGRARSACRRCCAAPRNLG